MIIRLKNADFSANNVGRIYMPNVNLNIGEGTNNPLLFKFSNAVGDGEFLGVSFITKTNPTPFPIVRKLHKGGTGSYLYEFQTAERATIDLPAQPESISMAIWINKSNWEATAGRPSGGDNNIRIVPQVYSSGWKATVIGADYAGRWLESEIDNTSNPEKTGTITGDSYLNYKVKTKVLKRETISGEDWICVGIVFYDLTYTSAIEDGAKLRIAFNAKFMTDQQDFEVGNMQVVISNDYISPDTKY